MIILGYEFWQRKFNGDRNIIGKTIRISRSDTPPTVIGVMPPGIRSLPSPTTAQEPNYNVNGLVDFWIPAAPEPSWLKARAWNVVARLRDGATAHQAQTELTVLCNREARAERDFAGIVPRVNFLTEDLNRDGRRILLPLLGAAALVLFIACGNAAALMLVRGLQRQQEYAVRSALGIARLALFRQVATECLLLAVLGGLLGVGLAVGVVKVFKVIAGHAIPRLDAVTTGWPVLACGLASAILASLLAGLFPALRASRLDPIHVLKSPGAEEQRGTGGTAAFAIGNHDPDCTNSGAAGGRGTADSDDGEFVEGGVRLGTGHILTMSVTAVQRDKWEDFHRRALERVATLPGVQAVAFAWGVPLTGNSWPATLEIEGQPAATKDSDRMASSRCGRPLPATSS